MLIIVVVKPKYWEKQDTGKVKAAFLDRPFNN
ncbi:hypothetical protein QFZ48_001167 [Chitinophaga sp. W2I13]